MRKKDISINLYDIKDNIFKKEGDRINLSKYKILGSGEGFNAEITARAATKLAVEKMAKNGGSIVLVGQGKVDVKQYASSKKEDVVKEDVVEEE